MVIEFCPMYSIGFLTSSEFVLLLQVQQEKSMSFMLIKVCFRSSELTAPYIYIYDLVTGLVGSYRHYLSRRSLCQTEKGDTYIHTPVYEYYCNTTWK